MSKIFSGLYMAPFIVLGYVACLTFIGFMSGAHMAMKQLHKHCGIRP